MGLMTKIDAVNQMLLASGESLVADLEEASGIDTGIAEFLLYQLTIDKQLRGLTNNKFEKKYVPNDDGHILLPDDMMSAELVSHHSNADGQRITGVPMGEPDAYMWNVTDQTKVWSSTETYTIELITFVPWEDMDTPVQRAITAEAVRQYQLVVQGDGEVDSYWANQEMKHQMKGKASDVRKRRRNILNNGPTAIRRAALRPMASNDPSRFRFWRTSNG